MLKFVNQTPFDIYIAYAFYSPNACADGDHFQDIGWFHAASGQGVIVYANSMTDEIGSTWLFHAHTADRQYVWDGPYPTTVPYAAFNRCVSDGTVGAAGEYEDVSFRAFDSGGVDNFTMNLIL